MIPNWAAVSISTISALISTLTYCNSKYAARLSQRAYLSHDAELYNRQELVKSVASDAPVIRVFFGFKVTNFGNTPAKGLLYTFTYDVPPHTRVFLGEGTSIRRLDIAPKQSRTLEVTLNYTNDGGANTANHFFKTTLKGEMSYQDVWGKSETTPICYVIVANATDARIANCPAPISVSAP